MFWPNSVPPVLVEACPNEKEPGLLVLEVAPKTLALVDVGVEETDWPKAGTELNPGWLKEKPLAGLLVACPKAGDCPNAVCPNTPGAEAPNAGLPNPELLACGVAAAVLAMLAATCPNTGVVEGAVAVLLESWLNAELELAAGGCVKTEEPEVAVPNTAVSVAGVGVLLETVLELLGVPEVSLAAEPAPRRTAATTAGPGPAKVEAGDTASVLLSGPPGATGVDSVAATRLAEDGGLLSVACTGAGSLLTGSEVCRDAWGSWADGGCSGSEGVDADTSLWSDLSGTAGGVASSVILPEDTGREEADGELRRPPNDNVGKDAGREGATEVDAGVAAAAALLVCWFPNEKLALLLAKEAPLKLMSPEGAALVRGTLPKTAAEELLVLALRAETGAAGAEDVTLGSTGFPNTEAPGKLNPEGLAGWAPARFVEEALLTGFVDSSAWPTRSPEKLPSVSPARELGKRSSPNLDGGVSNLLEAVDTVVSGAAGLLLVGAESSRDVVVTEVLGADGGPVAGAFPGMASQKGLPPPPNENASSWFDSLVGGAAPGVAVKLEDGAGVIVPKVKVPGEANEKGLLSCPVDGVEVTADSVLAVPGPTALSPEDS